MSNQRIYIISDETPDHLEVSTVSAAKFLNLQPQTLRKYRTTQLINIPYFKNPGIRGRVMYRVGDLRAYKQSLLIESLYEH